MKINVLFILFLSVKVFGVDSLDALPVLDRRILPLKYFPEYNDFSAVEITTFDEKMQVSEVAIPIFVRNLFPADSTQAALQVAQKGRKEYLAYALERVEYGITLSSGRGWPDEFKALRREVAEKYLERSAYYTIKPRDATTGKIGDKVATYREIFAPYSYTWQQKVASITTEKGKPGIVEQSFFFAPWRGRNKSVELSANPDLPMESLLGINLPRPALYISYNSDLDLSRGLSAWMNDMDFIGSRFQKLEYEGVIVEPGNLAVDPKYNKSAAGGFLIHPLSITKYAMQRAGLNPSAVPYYTYGNNVSVRQYRHQGFAKLTGFSEEGYPLRSMSESAYLWHPLAATYQNLEDYLRQIHEKRAGWTLEESRVLLQSFDALADFYSRAPEERAKVFPVTPPGHCSSVCRDILPKISSQNQ